MSFDCIRKLRREFLIRQAIFSLIALDFFLKVQEALPFGSKSFRDDFFNGFKVKGLARLCDHFTHFLRNF